MCSEEAAEGRNKVVGSVRGRVKLCHDVRLVRVCQFPLLPVCDDRLCAGVARNQVNVEVKYGLARSLSIVLNNVFYDCAEAAIVFPTQDNTAEGNLYLCETGGYLRVCREGRNWFETDFPNWLKEPPMTYAADQRSQEHGSYIIESIETGRVYRGHFNVINHGCITNLPPDCVVVTCDISWRNS